ncbi:MAG: glycosyltransferase family 2 protein [Alphaproteobacteria bacterium]|nr:glycosyltransferase family 2 protein [Alphaproteobacteria bacterium]MCZ6847265.1 glycosyltransferase family 2 protein [Alphaproteobacteria bacterium]
MDPILSVVVPVRNESENVLPLVEEIHAALEGGAAFEVVYVNDGSIDDTAAKLDQARARFPALRVVTHVSSCGQSAAIRSGVDAAKGAWIVTLDGDGQNDPADIPALVEIALKDGAAAEGGLHLIAGIRRRRRDSWLKRVSSRIANAVRQALLHDGVTDTGCGLKVIRRDAFLSLPYFDHMHRYLPALVIRGGGGVRCVDVNHRPRRSGVSNYGLFDRLWVGLSDLLGVAWLLRRAKRPVVKSDR